MLIGQPLDKPPQVVYITRVTKGETLLTQTPNTPSELLELNQNPVPTPEKTHTPKGVVDWLIEESGFQPSDMCELTKRLVYMLHNFHTHVVEKQLEEGDTDNLPMWICDTQKLETCLHLLKEI